MNLTLEPDFMDHPKVGRLTAEALRAHLKALCWCAKFETDGQIPSQFAIQFAPGELLGELVAGRLWVRNEDGSFAIRDFLEYNPSREELAAERARKKRRPARGKNTAHGGEKTPRGGAELHEPHKHIRPEEIAVTDQSPDPELNQPDRVISGRARWRRVPEDWRPKPAHLELARTLGVDAALELPKFRDHEFRDPKTDADAAFRTWLRNAKRFSPTPRPARPVQPSHGRTGFEDS